MIDQVGRDLETLNGQLKADVDAPARQLVLKLSAAEQRLNDLAALLAMPSAPARPSGSLADNAVWARELRAATDGTLARAQATITTLQQQHAEANAAISEALAAGGVADEAGLRQAIIEVSADRRRASDDIGRPPSRSRARPNSPGRSSWEKDSSKPSTNSPVCSQMASSSPTSSPASSKPSWPSPRNCSGR